MQYINLFLLTGKRDGLLVSFFSVSVFSFAFLHCDFSKSANANYFLIV